MKIKFTATCNTNKQEQDAKKNSELQAKSTKTTWKTFEETFRRGRNRSIKAKLLTFDDDDDDDDGWLKFYAESPTDHEYYRYLHIMRKKLETLCRWCHVE